MQHRMESKDREVYIVDGLRTPFLKAKGKPNPLSASDLAVACAKPLLERQSFPGELIEQVISGCVSPAPNEVNIGRIIALRLHCGNQMGGFTVQRNCGSAMQALDSAALEIRIGRHDLVLAGGTECMSRSPILWSPEMVSFLAELKMSKNWLQKLKVLTQFRPSHLRPVIGLLQGLTDPVVNMSMGMTAEKLAHLFKISREAMDAYALRSHTLAKQGFEKGYFEEVCPVYDYQGGVYTMDTGIRDSSLETLKGLPAVFDKPFGLVTAGNSSQVTDGAAFVLLASRDAVKKLDLPVLGRIVETTWAALDPTIMGLGPVYAISHLLKSRNLSISDIDYWEINEAYAAQVLACLQALQDEHFCQESLGLDKPLGSIPIDRLNVDGGAIAIGHPVGASGARIVLHLLHVLKRNKAKRGIASLCIGGGQGGAMLLESLEGEIG